MSKPTIVALRIAAFVALVVAAFGLIYNSDPVAAKAAWEHMERRW